MSCHQLALCPVTDVVMNKEVESHSWLWDLLVTLALIGLLALSYASGWLHGWWTGRNYILRLRHVRSDRLQRMLSDRERQVFELEDQLNDIQQQLRRELPTGPITADRDIKKLQMNLNALEHSFWYKSQQLRALDRKRMELIRRLGRLRGLVDESRDLAARARLEAANHAHWGEPFSWLPVATCGTLTTSAPSFREAKFWISMPVCIAQPTM